MLLISEHHSSANCGLGSAPGTLASPPLFWPLKLRLFQGLCVARCLKCSSPDISAIKSKPFSGPCSNVSFLKRDFLTIFFFFFPSKETWKQVFFLIHSGHSVFQMPNSLWSMTIFLKKVTHSPASALHPHPIPVFFFFFSSRLPLSPSNRLYDLFTCVFCSLSVPPRSGRIMSFFSFFFLADSSLELSMAHIKCSINIH